MKRPIVAGIVALMLPFGHAAAAEFKIDSLVIESPWTRATPKGASVAKRFQIHSTTIADGVAKMREVTAGVEIKPGETVRFEPGGSHLMFVNLMQPLHEGEKVRGTLKFERVGTIDIEYAVLGMGAKAPGAEP